jgi:hypothetical protein
MITVKWIALFSVCMLAGCAELPLTEIADVHTWVAEWHYEAPEGFYANTAFLHCGNAREYGDGTGKLSWQGETPTQIQINRLASGSDRVDGFSEEGYHSNVGLISPVDQHSYFYTMLQRENGATFSGTRTMEAQNGTLYEVTETVTLTKLGAVSMIIDRNQYGCD